MPTLSKPHKAVVSARFFNHELIRTVLGFVTRTQVSFTEELMPLSSEEFSVALRPSVVNQENGTHDAAFYHVGSLI